MSAADAVLGVGGPLGALPADVLVREAFGAELEQQRGLLDDVGLADLAYTVMALETGVVPQRPGVELLRGLLALQAHPADFTLDAAFGDVYTNREAWLGAHAGGAGWLGVGRARREAITTGFTLVARKRVAALVRALANAGHALVAVAARHARSPMPDYTYLQAGQPTSFGHYLLGFAFALLRDIERARALYARIDRCPAGCGSTNGSSLPLDRERVATLLGFAALVDHARDAMWQADLPIEALGVACAASVNLDRLAEDLALFATAEFGFIALADEHSRASKVMPQKKNPFALAYVRAVANRTIGVQAGIAAAGRTPSGQMDNRFAAYGDVPKALADVAGAADLMAAVIRGLTFDAAAAQATLERSFAAASDVAELVMRTGDVDYRTAHALVGGLARAPGALTATVKPTSEAIDAAARTLLGRPLSVPQRDIDVALDPAAALERRGGIGGASARSVAAMLANVRAALGETARWHARVTERAAAAERALFDVARRLAEVP